MTIELVFLDVGNADSIVVHSEDNAAIILDMPKWRIICQWLKKRDCTYISAVYLTHAHDDHSPSLLGLYDFLVEWLRHHDPMQRIVLPEEIWHEDIERMEDPKKKALLLHALSQFDVWEYGTGDSPVAIDFLRGEQGVGPHQYNEISLTIIHPSMKFRERIRLDSSNNINETSLGLRLDYGSFRALLLADIEKQGLKSLLDYYSGTRLSYLECQLVKIPHHGAWNHTEKLFYDLMSLINPEIAILSVGSTNNYRHVVPDLFITLLGWQMKQSSRLKRFVCTELTRTCILSAIERRLLDKKGLRRPLPCAGDIIIRASSNGGWEHIDAHYHLTKIRDINQVPFPACLHLMDLDLDEHS